MTDRRFYLLLTLLVLTLAAGEVVYAMVGPLSAPTHQVDDLSSINRVPVEIINEKTIADFTRVVEQTGILEREPLTCSGPNKGGPARWTLTS